jgi:5-methylcytosine-specific restriction endonuclease McrA
VVQKIAEFRHDHLLEDLVTVDRAQRLHPEAFDRLERDVVATIVRFPIPLLQKVGIGGRAVEQRFIYEYGWTTSIQAAAVHRSSFDDRMWLADRAGEHLSALAGLLRPLIQRDWLQFVARRNDADVEELRLEQFLFGADRIGLGPLTEPLRELQEGRCFYCDRLGDGGWEVDHFLPWSRWPDNRLDNLVLAHARCNNDKRAALAGVDHLVRWWPRFDPSSSLSDDLDRIATKVGWARNVAATKGAARALYLRQPTGMALWVGRPGRVEQLDRDRVVAVMRPGYGLAADERGDYRPER